MILPDTNICVAAGITQKTLALYIDIEAKSTDNSRIHTIMG